MIAQPLEPTQTIAQDGLGVDHVADRRAQVGRKTAIQLVDIPAVLRPSELRDWLGYSRAHFARLEKAGRFVDLEAAVVLGERRYSGLKLYRALVGDQEAQGTHRSDGSGSRRTVHRKTRGEHSREGGLK